MKTALRWTLRITAVLILLLVTVLLSKDAILRFVIERRIQQQTGLHARIGHLKLGLGSATVRLEDFKLHNPPEFGGAPLLDIPLIHLELDADAAAAGQLRFKEIRFHLAEVNVVRHQDGRLNLEELPHPALPKTPSPTHPPGQPFEFGGIDTLRLTLGKVHYTDLQHPDNSYSLDLNVTDAVATQLQTEEDVQTWVTGLLLRVAVQEYFNNPRQSKGAGLRWLRETLK